jgi:hypothetical protein
VGRCDGIFLYVHSSGKSSTALALVCSCLGSVNSSYMEVWYIHFNFNSSLKKWGPDDI